MQTLKSIPFVLVALFFLASPTMVWAYSADGDYEEVSYDDLLNELSAKKKSVIRNQTSSFDDVRLHAGIGYVNSFSNISTNNKNFNRHANGIQLSLGMDLFSSNWYSEGVFRNYGITSFGTEELSLKEFDLKVGYKDLLEGIWSFTVSAGLSNRFLRFSDPSQNINVSATTPSLVTSAGFLAQVHRNISLGAEVNGRTSMISQTADRNSFDFAFRINTSL